MSLFLTPEQASEFDCPVARTHGNGETGNCRAGDCIVWRWVLPLASDESFKGAIQREIACLQQDDEEAGRKKRNKHLLHQTAVANVMRNPEDYGVLIGREKGYCGLGGKP